MGQNRKKIVTNYTHIFTQLKKKLRWHMIDERVLMVVASFYIMNEKEFSLERLIYISEHIKKNVGLFSTLRSPQRFTTAAMLDIRYENSTEKFAQYVEVYERFVKGGFQRGAFTYISALTALEIENTEALIERSKAVHKAMKKEHFFLTGTRDYPLAVLLAQLDDPIDEMMEKIAYFYRGLNDSGFKRGNDLQFLSHILSLQKEVDGSLLVERCDRLKEQFKLAGRKIKPSYYPVIGLLAILENSEKEVANVMSLSDRLNKEKRFKWHKDLNFLMSVNFVVKEQIDDTSLMSTGIQTTVEAIIQAQQAAMVAVMAGGASAAASSGGNS